MDAPVRIALAHYTVAIRCDACTFRLISDFWQKLSFLSAVVTHFEPVKAVGLLRLQLRLLSPVTFPQLKVMHETTVVERGVMKQRATA